jgi:hypothetical protein
MRHEGFNLKIAFVPARRQACRLLYRSSPIATAESARAKSAGNAFPRLAARRRIPAQDFALK